MSRVQQTYDVNPDIGFAGSLAEPNSPHRVEGGVLHVPAAATRMPRPGDELYYDTTENQWAIPTSAAQSLLVAGILSYRADTVANASSILEFADEAEIEIATMGVWWAVAGSAMEYGTICSWDRGGLPVRCRRAGDHPSRTSFRGRWSACSAAGWPRPVTCSSSASDSAASSEGQQWLTSSDEPKRITRSAPPCTKQGSWSATRPATPSGARRHLRSTTSRRSRVRRPGGVPAGK